MLNNIAVVSADVVAHDFEGFVDLDFCFVVSFEHEEYPCVGVDVGVVIWLLHESLCAHLFGALQVLILQRQVVSVVVERSYVVRSVDEAGIVCFKRFFVIAEVVVEVAE